MKRKILSIVLLVCVLAAAMTPAAFADMPSQGNLYFDVKDMTADVYQCMKGTSGTVTIPSVFEGKPVTGITDGAFKDCDQVTKVVIPDTVNSIGSNAFEGCSSLKSIALPESAAVGSEAFLNCTSLNEVVLPKTSIAIWPNAFRGTPIYTDSGNWSDGQFYIGTALISVPENTVKCTVRPGTTLITGDAFRKLNQIGEHSFTLSPLEVESIVLPDSVQYISNHAFSDCETLKTITIPAGIKALGAFCFSGCIGLSDIYFGGTEAQWNALTKGLNMIELKIATVHFNDADAQTPATPDPNPSASPKPSPSAQPDQPPAEKPANTKQFQDVKPGDYFYDPVAWAVKNGITNGTSDTTFSPGLACTRAQMVTFLWRAVGSPKPDITKNPFSDVSKDAYYYDAVLWAVQEEITKGTSDTTFSPDATLTRGQTVTFLWRSADAPAPAAKASAFSDVAGDQYYAAAVLWAVEHQITYGTSDTTFSPDGSCTRAQIVTFLYRNAEP